MQFKCIIGNLTIQILSIVLKVVAIEVSVVSLMTVVRVVAEATYIIDC